MSRLVASAETWETVYTAYNNINFAAFDYNTVKQSLLDYIKLYFPETFNDFIESSELIAIVEVFAYIAELLAYRFDVDAHENFITVAQRKDSILRLAKYISYTASRPLPARGLVKFTSVSTTESVIDSNGNNLANQVIRWNDVSNPNWKDQFTTAMNRVLTQEFGTVSPSDRFQIQNVLFEIYSVNAVPTATGVFTYTASSAGQSAPMELVPVAYDTSVGIIERRPANNADFTILYGQDGLGDASSTTGFFCYTKQGQLQRAQSTFDGITANQSYTVAVNNINNTDVWVNNVDPVTGNTLDTASTLPYRPATLAGKSGEWVEVDLASAQNVIFNTNPSRNKYELETLANNQIRILFGDGEFADIPGGTFDIWTRSSLDQDIVIPQSAVTNTSSSFTYVDIFGNTQTFTFTYSLISSLQNASASEDIEHVRVVAPAVYYSQDRMVNGQDYNSFMLQDSSILKLRAVNRTFAGDSRYMVWHDPSGTYENVKVFSDDGMIYFEDITSVQTTPVVDNDTLITTYVEPLLSSTDMLIWFLEAGVPFSEFNNVFSPAEKAMLNSVLSAPYPAIVDMYYNIVTFMWYSVKQSAGPSLLPGWPADYITTPIINITQTSNTEFSYNVSRVAKRVIFQSPTTAFWNTNEASRVIDFATLNADYDEIDILQANIDNTRTNVLTETWRFSVLGQEVVTSGPNLGLADISRISVLPVDTNMVGFPPGLDVDNPVNPEGLAQIINPKYTVNVTAFSSFTLTLPIYYVVGAGDVIISTPGVTWTEDLLRPVSNTIDIISTGSNTTLQIEVREYVYLTRLTTNDPWVPAASNTQNMNSYVLDATSAAGLWSRSIGRSGLNFMWIHHTPNNYLVDPAASNIIDIFIITKGYYLLLKQWLTDPLATQPAVPTPLDLRTTYGYLLNNAMISDTVVSHSGTIKLLFGSKADATLQATFKVIRAPQSTLTDNQIKTVIVTTIQNFFDISFWEFGETFYATELFAAIHLALPSDISSVALVPVMSQNHFGNLFQVVAGENEVFYPDISVNNIQLVTGYTSTNLNI